MLLLFPYRVVFLSPESFCLPISTLMWLFSSYLICLSPVMDPRLKQCFKIQANEMKLGDNDIYLYWLTHLADHVGDDPLWNPKKGSCCYGYISSGISELLHSMLRHYGSDLNPASSFSICISWSLATDLHLGLLVPCVSKVPCLFPFWCFLPPRTCSSFVQIFCYDWRKGIFNILTDGPGILQYWFN